jgi:uncharacterized protein (TIGR02996 family)
MAVYFVLRSPYDSPSGKQIARYDDADLNAWIRRNWEFGRTHPKEAESIPDFGPYGKGVSGFSLFFQAAEHAGPPPEDPEELEEFLREAIYAEGAILCRPHVITVLHDDDELEFVYYIFDDHYVRKYPARAAFLLHGDRQLPTDAIKKPFRPREPVNDEKPRGKGEGAVYWTREAFEDSCNLSDPMAAGLRLKGVRIPDLARYLAQHKPGNWSDYWLLLRTRLFATGATSDPLEERFREALLDDPDDETTWAAYSDWLQERGHPPAGLSVLERALRSLAHYASIPGGGEWPDGAWDAVRTGTVREVRAALDLVMQARGVRGAGRPKHDPAKTIVRVTEHVVEFYWHVGRMFDQQDLYHQWVFFDDQWAAAHPDLANSLLRYKHCWDMLSPDGPSDADFEE